MVAAPRVTPAPGGCQRPPDGRRFGHPADPRGYFPEGSILRKVHSERAVGLFYGQRALMIGALNPLAFVGTIEQTNAKLKPFQRLVHTRRSSRRSSSGPGTRRTRCWPLSTSCSPARR